MSLLFSGATSRCSFMSQDLCGHGLDTAFHHAVRRLCDEHDKEVQKLQNDLKKACLQVEALYSHIQSYCPDCMAEISGFDLPNFTQEFKAPRYSQKKSSHVKILDGPSGNFQGLCEEVINSDPNSDEDAEEKPAPTPRLKRQGTGMLVRARHSNSSDEDEEEEEEDAKEREADDNVPSQDGKAVSQMNDTTVAPVSRGAWSEESRDAHVSEPWDCPKETAKVWPANEDLATSDLAIQQPALRLGSAGKKGCLKMSGPTKAVVGHGVGAPMPQEVPVQMPTEEPPQLESVVPNQQVYQQRMSNGSMKQFDAQNRGSHHSADLGPAKSLGSELCKSNTQETATVRTSGFVFLKPITDAVRRLSGNSNASESRQNEGKHSVRSEDSNRVVEKTLSSRANNLVRQFLPTLQSKGPEREPVMTTVETPKQKTQRISWHISVDEAAQETVRQKSTTFKVRQRWILDERSLSDREHRGSALRSKMDTIAKTHDADDGQHNADGKISKGRSSFALDEIMLAKITNDNACWFDRFMSTPNSRFNFVWDIISMALIGYDVVMIPFDVFDPTDIFITSVMGFITGIFWTLDILRTFGTGYYKKGDIVMQSRAVAKNYIMTWFFIDAAIVSFDWTYIISKYSGNNKKVTNNDFQRHVRGLRSARGLRLLRGVKMARIMKTIEDRITSERNSVLANVLMLFIGLVLLNHVVACIWYFIGKTCQGDLDSWIDHHLAPLDDIWYRYFTSFHWALTQFTPASIAVQPHNIWERLFGVIVLLFALVSVSSFVSGITSAVMFLRNLGSAKSKQFWLLRRYLRESEVPTMLALRIQRYCDFAWQSRETRLQEKAVQALGLLSAGLRADMNTAILEPRLWSHPLFLLFSKLAPPVMNRLCNTAVTRSTMVRGDTVFQVGDARTCCDIVIGGDAVYSRDMVDKPASLVEINKDTWLCEIVLWSTWTCVGTLTTVSDCDMVSIDCDKFAQVIRSSEETKLEAAVYARGFVHGLNHFSKVTDLFRHSSQIEGLWFRLLNEFNVSRKESHRRSTLLFHHHPLSTRTQTTIME